jgi:hypothetical protein
LASFRPAFFLFLLAGLATFLANNYEWRRSIPLSTIQRRIPMKTIVIVLALLAGSVNAFAQEPQPNAYAACIAEAGRTFGSVLTIENLRQYMIEHPSCAGDVPTKTTMPPDWQTRPQTASITGHDLMIDLDRWANKEIHLSHVRVFGADNQGALAQASGATFKISIRGIDPEAFRKFLKDCHGLMNPACDGLNLTVMPTGEISATHPILINVRLGH